MSGMKICCNKNLIADQVDIACSFYTRFIGLMNKKTIASSEGLLLVDCPSVHCFFMKFPIDAIYLSDDMRVIYCETLKPWQTGKRVTGAAHVLELPAGTAEKRIACGDILEITAD